MPKYLLLLLALCLSACTSDPLEVQEIESEDSAATDGLQAVTVAEVADQWSRSEDGALTATAPATLTILPDHGPLTLAMSLLIEEGTEAILKLGDSYKLYLPNFSLDGTTEKRSSAVLKPGVWQDVELAYQPGSPTSPPLLIAAYLNGNLVYYQDSLSGSGGGKGPLTLEVTQGTLTIDEVRTLDRAGRSSTVTSTGEVELNLPLIRYAYYNIEGDPDEVTDYGRRTPDKEGYISRFDLAAIRDKPSGYAVRFTADLDIPQAGEYTFDLFSPGSARLYIDDERVVELTGKQGASWGGNGSINLSEGQHRFRLDLYQNHGWNRLNLSYTTPDGNTGSLNDLPQGQPVTTPAAGEPTVLETDDRPYLLRSFLNFPRTRIYDFTDKRTHVMNVGEADGPHYSYDLQRGSLLMAWRGGFVDVSEMWVDRGEPQVVRPLGDPIAFDGKAAFASSLDRWPDSLTDLRHLRYELDDAGRPTFFFGGGGQLLSDQIIPSTNGLQRTLTNAEGETTYVQVAAARLIAETGSGSFELRGPGARVEITDLAAGGLRLLRGDGVDRLVAELPVGEHITYSLDW